MKASTQYRDDWRSAIYNATGDFVKTQRAIELAELNGLFDTVDSQAASQGTAGGERDEVQTTAPVAWRYRFVTSVDGKELSDWFIVDDPKSIPSREGQTVQPLYVGAAQAGQVPVPNYEFPYQATFDAIIAATNILGERSMGISVRKFQEAFNSHRDKRHISPLPSASRGTEA